MFFFSWVSQTRYLTNAINLQIHWKPIHTYTHAYTMNTRVNANPQYNRTSLLYYVVCLVYYCCCSFRCVAFVYLLFFSNTYQFYIMYPMFRLFSTLMYTLYIYNKIRTEKPLSKLSCIKWVPWRRLFCSFYRAQHIFD